MARSHEDTTADAVAHGLFFIISVWAVFSVLCVTTLGRLAVHLLVRVFSRYGATPVVQLWLWSSLGLTALALVIALFTRSLIAWSACIGVVVAAFLALALLERVLLHVDGSVPDEELDLADVWRRQ